MLNLFTIAKDYVTPRYHVVILIKVTFSSFEDLTDDIECLRY